MTTSEQDDPREQRIDELCRELVHLIANEDVEQNALDFAVADIRELVEDYLESLNDFDDPHVRYTKGGTPIEDF